METKGNNDEIIVLEPIIYTFAKPFRGDDAREVYNAVAGRIAKDFKNAPVFSGYFKFNEETQEINGSDLYHGILINEELRKSGLWLPSVQTGKILDAKKKLTNGVYRDYGLAVYNAQNPNSELAQKLIKEADKKSWETPLVAPSFDALKLKKDASVSFNQDSRGIITGEEAQKYFKENFNYIGNSGVQGLLRDRHGGWVAGWYDLADSGDCGRVDWVCGEATAQNLEKAVLEDIDKVSRSEMEKLKAKITSSKEAALKILRS